MAMWIMPASVKNKPGIEPILNPLAAVETK
jgi:hypothetical protein